jgi:hypothetical protein
MASHKLNGRYATGDHINVAFFQFLKIGNNNMAVPRAYDMGVTLPPLNFSSSSLLPFGSLLHFWSLGLIYQFLDHSQTVGLLGRVISAT